MNWRRRSIQDKSGRCFNLLLAVMALYVFVVFTLVILLHPAKAVMENLSQSFTSQQELAPGSLVSVDSNNEKEVVLANKQNDKYLIGVVVELDSSLLAVNSNEGNIQVAISGQAMTLVSNIAGDIVAGDLIAQSEIDGVGTKAREGDRILGIAQGAFNDASTGATLQTVVDERGQSKDVSIGIVSVLIVASSITAEDNNSSVIEKWATKIVGKPVSITRLAICIIIAVIGITSSIVLIYSSTRNAIAAAGRNPLAKPVILESLAQIMSMTALIAVIAVAAMYLVAVL
jgi:hypothetical protein